MSDDEVKKAGRIIAWEFVGVACLCVMFVIAVNFVANLFRPYDDTDGSSRSGMEIFTDCRTGLQYLSAGRGGLSPRLDVNGRQIVEPCK